MEKITEKIIGNYTSQTNRGFPLDCETLKYIKDNQSIAEVFGNALGDKVILLGCDLYAQDTCRKEGYVFVRTQDYPNGEILWWKGGAAASMKLVKEAVPVTAHGHTYSNAYSKRRLEPGRGDETYNWEDFADVSSQSGTLRGLSEKCAELEKRLSESVTEPVGVIKMWAGSADKDKLPGGYLVCDGEPFNEEQYPDLREVLGTNKTPDLQGRFVVGYDPNVDDYKKVGNHGGERSHILTVDEMPKHTHTFKDLYYPEAASHLDASNKQMTIGSKEKPYNSGHGSNATDHDNHNVLYYEHDTLEAGGGLAHENRPPYYVLIYIIKAK